MASPRSSIKSANVNSSANPNASANTNGNVNLGIPASATRTGLLPDTASGKDGVRRNRSFSFQENAPKNLSAETSQGSVGSTAMEFVDEDFDSPDFDPSSLSRVSITSNKVVKVVDNKPSVVGKYMCGNNVVVQAIVGTLVLCAMMAITLFVLSWGYL